MHQLVLVIGVERRHFRYNTDKISFNPCVQVFKFKIDARYLKKVLVSSLLSTREHAYSQRQEV